MQRDHHHRVARESLVGRWVHQECALWRGGPRHVHQPDVKLGLACCCKPRVHGNGVGVHAHRDMPQLGCVTGEPTLVAGQIQQPAGRQAAQELNHSARLGAEGARVVIRAARLTVLAPLGLLRDDVDRRDVLSERLQELNGIFIPLMPPNDLVVLTAKPAEQVVIKHAAPFGSWLLPHSPFMLGVHHRMGELLELADSILLTAQPERDVIALEDVVQEARVEFLPVDDGGEVDINRPAEAE